jgi:hypothetical protein
MRVTTTIDDEAVQNAVPYCERLLARGTRQQHPDCAKLAFLPAGSWQYTRLAPKAVYCKKSVRQVLTAGSQSILDRLAAVSSADQRALQHFQARTQIGIPHRAMRLTYPASLRKKRSSELTAAKS